MLHILQGDLFIKLIANIYDFHIEDSRLQFKKFVDCSRTMLMKNIQDCINILC